MNKVPPLQTPVNPANTTSGHVFRRIHKGSGSSKLITHMLGEVSKDTGVHVSTLEDMFEKMKMTLSHSCPKCGSVWVSTPEELLAKFPKETPLKEVRMDCKCGCAKITSSPVSL